MKIDNYQSVTSLAQQTKNSVEQDKSSATNVAPATNEKLGDNKVTSSQPTPSVIVEISGLQEPEPSATYGFGGSNQKPPP